jgi:HlyD family secretion protein
MKNILLKAVFPLVAVGLLVYAIVFVGRQDRGAPSAPPAVPPPGSPFEYAVAGAGLVEAQTENISIGSPTPGVVTKVLVKVDQKVKPGEPLFELDDRQLQAELQSRKASLASAQADLKRMENEPRPEELQMSAAQVAEARANLATQQDQYNRIEELFNRKAETAEALIGRRQALRAAEAQLAHAQAEYDEREKGAWEFDLDVARARIKEAEARVEQTVTELDRLVVRTLVDGRVLQVNVRPGEFVGAPPGQALIVLGNIEKLHVRVDIDENDIPRFVPGSPGIALLRGQSDVEFPLSFVRVEPYVVPKRSLTGDNTERVDTRVLQVIYAIDTRGRPLYVGQQLDVYIKSPPAVAKASAAPLAQAPSETR